MIYQIKIFDLYKYTEDEINKWFKDNPYIEIKHAYFKEFKDQWGVECTSFIIVYRELLDIEKYMDSCKRI
jgi:hypothetical protein